MSLTPADLPCACSSLRKASRVVTRLYDEALAGYGLTVTQFAILRALARLGEPPLSRLAESMVMDRTSLYRTLAPMTEHGWVSVDAAASGRAKLARLTSAGRALLEQAGAGWDAAQDRFIGAFGPEDWAAVSAALQKVLELAGEGA